MEKILNTRLLYEKIIYIYTYIVILETQIRNQYTITQTVTVAKYAGGNCY